MWKQVLCDDTSNNIDSTYAFWCNPCDFFPIIQRKMSMFAIDIHDTNTHYTSASYPGKTCGIPLEVQMLMNVIVNGIPLQYLGNTFIVLMVIFTG